VAQARKFFLSPRIKHQPIRSAGDVSPGVFAQPAALLVERGWSIGDVRKVLGENFLRVARAVWK